MFVKGIYYEHLDIVLSFRYKEKRLVNLYIIPETLEKYIETCFLGFLSNQGRDRKTCFRIQIIIIFFKDILSAYSVFLPGPFIIVCFRKQMFRCQKKGQRCILEIFFLTEKQRDTESCFDISYLVQIKKNRLNHCLSDRYYS